MEWSQKKILLFIEQYHNKLISWDPQYYNKIKKVAAKLETMQEECKQTQL